MCRGTQNYEVRKERWKDTRSHVSWLLFSCEMAASRPNIYDFWTSIFDQPYFLPIMYSIYFSTVSKRSYRSPVLTCPRSFSRAPPLTLFDFYLKLLPPASFLASHPLPHRSVATYPNFYLLSFFSFSLFFFFFFFTPCAPICLCSELERGRARRILIRAETCLADANGWQTCTARITLAQTNFQTEIAYLSSSPVR